MQFKAKLSKQGNSYCVYVPKDVRTKLKEDCTYEWSVRTEDVVEVPVIGTIDSATEKVIYAPDTFVPERDTTYIKPKFNTEPCLKHEGSMKGTCGCK